jgi:ABC-type amino acid transport substrate-binding protein
VGFVTVPDVSRLDEATARDELVNAGLVVGETVLRASRRVPAGLVIRTVPAADEVVEAGTSVRLIVSQGPPASPSPSVIPTLSPSPLVTEAPSGVPSASAVPVGSTQPGASPLGGDALARVLASGVLRVNVAPDAAPWSSSLDGDEPSGFDVQVARRIARQLGVDVAFTTFPVEDGVLAGTWDDRWDIAMGHLLASDERGQVLQLTQPYAWDQLRIAVSESSGLSPDDMAGRALCVAIGSPVQGWLDGTVTLVDQDGNPVAPPEGAQALPSPTDADCLDALVAGTVDGWIASGPTILAAQENDPTITSSEPVAIAPVVVATGLAGSSDTSLRQAVDDAITGLLDEGVLVRASRRFLGDDLTVPPLGEVPQPSGSGPVPSEEVVEP